ncbi:AraC family transcriptional regulator [Cohnella zeiphila]|uniref:Helix-turn-helix transcriptional regulator n=1 Tax=Cohnella zeiphila TaxID=2761120 RepID=A0A7X0VXB7_9BACL|nr:AraC family transcriptional regulator [Cohnella zeiphila]MBB6733267.1 helix-turn-helix transcriptional regulator [Cohnella zeiphila]
MASDWSFEPAAVSNVFWQRKKEFELACDTYGEWVLFAVTDGEFRYRIGQSEGEAGFGDLVFCPPETEFRREVVRPLTFHFYRFRWVPVPWTPERQAEADPAWSPPRPCGAVAVRDHARLSSAYAYLQRFENAEEPRRLAVAQAMFRDLWQLVCIEGLVERSDEPQADALMAEAEQWIRRHAFESLRLRDFSDRHGLSAVQFTRRFQAAWGQSPIDFATSLRLTKARSLLLETRLTLDEIARQCGYENGFYFSRIFTRKMNVNPSRFRKMNRL